MKRTVTEDRVSNQSSHACCYKSSGKLFNSTHGPEMHLTFKHFIVERPDDSQVGSLPSTRERNCRCILKSNTKFCSSTQEENMRLFFCLYLNIFMLLSPTGEDRKTWVKFRANWTASVEFQSTCCRPNSAPVEVNSLLLRVSKGSSL